MNYYIGLPEWRHPSWYAAGAQPKNPLQIYSRHLSSVEGNTSFYALPKPSTVELWKESTPDDFRFCFKFPRTISHDAQLRHCAREVVEFLDRVSPLESKLGVLWLHVGKEFGPEQLPILRSFLETLPKDFRYGIEVRNPNLFRKDEAEAGFNRLLQKHAVNRVIFDTRILFKHPANDSFTKEALEKKPRLPLHVVATGDQPFLRFIAPMDIELADKALDQWVSKTLQWLEEGKTPFLFFHTPDKLRAPELAEVFSQKLAAKQPSLQPISLWQQQPEQNQLW